MLGRKDKRGAAWVAGLGALLCPLFGGAGAAQGQCSVQWLPGFPTPALQGSIGAMLSFDPDGAGPLPQHLAVGGSFTSVEGFPGSGFLLWDGVTWRGSASAGTSVNVRGLVWWNGAVHAVGSFTIGGVSGVLARWDGANLVLVPSVLQGSFPAVNSVTVHDGGLMLGGNFTSIAGVANTRSLARWDGTSFSSVGGSVQSVGGLTTSVDALDVFEGDLIIAGNFERVGAGAGVNTVDAARWSPAGGWRAMGSLAASQTTSIRTLAVHDNQLFAGGTSNLGSAIRWDGAAWQAIAGAPLSVFALRSFGGGLVASAGNTGQGANATGLTRWNGTTWSVITDGPRRLGVSAVGDQWWPRVLVEHEGRLVFASAYVQNLAASSNFQRGCLLTWDGTDFGTFAKGLDGPVLDMVEYEGDLVLLGRFWMAGGRRVNGAARWNGTTFEAMGDGPIPSTWSTSIPSAQSIGVSDGQVFGDLLCVAGSLRPWTGNPQDTILSGTKAWDGAAWINLAADPFLSPAGPMYSLAVHNDELFCAGAGNSGGNATGVLRFDGSNWVGTGITTGARVALASHNGALYAGSSSSSVQAWNGTTTWTGLGTSAPFCVNLLSTGGGLMGLFALQPNVRTLVNGSFVALGNAAFHSPNQAFAGRLLEFQGDLLASSDVVAFSRWNSIAWAPLANVLIGGDISATQIRGGGGMAVHEGVLWLGGQIARVDGVPMPFVARAVVGAGPAIAQQPVGVASCVSGAAGFAIATAGNDVVTYRWRRSGALLADGALAGGQAIVAGSATNALTLTNLGAADGGVYDCVATTACGTVISAGALLTVGQTCPPTCDSIDFNNDGSLFDPDDVDAFFSVFSEGPCIPATATCNDLDFNNDGSVFDPCDLDAFLLAFSEGPCTLCGL